MNITLRKANTIQEQLNELLKNIKLETSININEFEDSANKISMALAQFTSDLDRRNRIVSAIYEIRKLVSVANHETMINLKLCEIAHIEKDIQLSSTLAKSELRTEHKVLEGRLDKIRSTDNQRSTLYGVKDEVVTGIFTVQERSQFESNLRSLKKNKQKLKDELLEINVRTVITVDEKTALTLHDEGLI